MSTPTTFEAHGQDWYPHKAGDPMPCEGYSKIHVQIRSQASALQLSSFVDYASSWCWQADENDRDGEIIGWRYAAHPQEKDELARLREENASMRTAIKYACESLPHIHCPDSNDLFLKRAVAAALQPFTESK